MKLVIREYLSSLRERDELDAILPDLLSQMGLNVYSRPARGTRQNGVDIAAVGSLDGGPAKVYLYSVKAGDLSRKEWDGDSIQSLRPSLNEILDSYIPNRMPVEHRGKDIVICIAIGGDVQEQVRPQLTGYIEQTTSDKVTFEEWNGDKLASLIQATFLREDLLPPGARSNLRKSLAMLDDPEISYRYFAALIRSLPTGVGSKDSDQITALRQIAICLWILFSWARDNGNMESAYLSAEIALLYSWSIVRRFLGHDNKAARAGINALLSTFQAYQGICDEFMASIIPHVSKLHALSSAVQPSTGLDVNLKMFDLVGRVATQGIWSSWILARCSEAEAEQERVFADKLALYISSIKALISTNPVLLLPIKDDQSTDMSVALLLLALDKGSENDKRLWLNEVIDRATFALTVDGSYPCILESYSDLLSHPKKGDSEYRKKVTSASVLYPVIALNAAVLRDVEIYSKIAGIKQKQLQHCNFQMWYPDETSEEYLYTNNESHGATLSDVAIDQSPEIFLDQIFRECERSPCEQLSAVRYGWWPLVIVACRHHRLPIPVHFLKALTTGANPEKGGVERATSGCPGSRGVPDPGVSSNE